MREGRWSGTRGHRSALGGGDSFFPASKVPLSLQDLISTQGYLRVCLEPLRLERKMLWSILHGGCLRIGRMFSNLAALPRVPSFFPMILFGKKKKKDSAWR